MEDRPVFRKNDLRLFSRLFPFYFGTYLTQFSNNAFQVVQPLVILDLMGKASLTAYLMMGYGIINAFGSSLGGFLYSQMKPKTMLTYFCFGRAFCQFGVAVTYWFDDSLWYFILLLYGVDALFIGILDTARQSLPKAVVGVRSTKAKETKLLHIVNSNFQMLFDLGTTTGPIVTGFIMLEDTALWKLNMIAPPGFAVAAVVFLLLPSVSGAPRNNRKDSSHLGIAATFKTLYSNRVLAFSFFAFVSLQVYRLKSVYSALFATQVFLSKQYTPWMVAAFGVGGVSGSFLFHRLSRSWCCRVRDLPGGRKLVQRPSMNSIFMFFGAVGLLVFAVMWVPVHYTPHLSNDWHFGMVEFMIVLFMILNVFGRLAMTSLMQTELTAENNGAIIGLRGTFVKLTASGLRALLGIAFSATGEDGFLSFVIFSGVLALFALIQIIFSFLLGKTSLPSSAGDPELRHKRAYRSMTINEASDSSSDSDSGDDEEDPRGILITGVDDVGDRSSSRGPPLLSEQERDGSQGRSGQEQERAPVLVSSSSSSTSTTTAAASSTGSLLSPGTPSSASRST